MEFSFQFSDCKNYKKFKLLERILFFLCYSMFFYIFVKV